MKSFLPIAFALALATAPAFGEAPKTEIKADDTILTVLTRQVGQRVELHLKSGKNFAGKLESASGSTAHISSVSGQEFFDAIISVPEISAVLVRAR